MMMHGMSEVKTLGALSKCELFCAIFLQTPYI